MLRLASRVSPRFHGPKGPHITTRSLFQMKTTFTNYDSSGNLITKKIPITIGNIEETFVLIKPDIGYELNAASPDSTTSLLSSSLTDTAEERYTCKLTFFHDSRHFGFGYFNSRESSYPRLYIPNQLPRQTEMNTSPATLFMGGVMHEIALDGTPDHAFAAMMNESGRRLAPTFRQLEKC
ncbi:hypothetical protein N7456_007962 [Penicillium angulare]|uniref:Uncharacterized protein n=1 Tax=Penicillium angulare TaxID=116970 RepID=A0A9W9FBU3_9EURO|nr:hypothetical protein N7456_007962 [Penicillium angulare]